MELRHFKYFITVAEYLHFGRAATALKITQPVLSRQIQQMEREMGIRLFERDKRSVVLTHAGLHFLESARHILSQSENAIDAARRAAAGRMGSLRIASGPVTSYCVLPVILEIIKKQMTDVDLFLWHAQTPDQVSSLLSHEIDVGFLVPPLNHTGLRTRLIMQESFVSVLPKEHRLSSRKQISLQELSSEQFVFPLRRPTKSGLYGTLENICHNAGFVPNVAHEAYPIQTMLTLVASGFGVSIVPASVEHFLHAKVAFVPIRDRVTIQYVMATRENETSPVVKSFVELLSGVTIKPPKREANGKAGRKAAGA